MKVCLVVSDFAPRLGGIATFNTGLSAALCAHPEVEEVRVIVLQGNETSQENLPKLSVRRFPRRGAVRIFLRVLYELWQVRDYDIVHSPNVFPVGFFALILFKYILRKPVVITFHGTDVLAREGSMFTKWAKKFAVLHASATTTVSHAAQRVVALRLGVIPERFPVIYYALPAKVQSIEENVRRRYGIAADNILILNVGNLLRRKGIDDIIRAVALAQNPRLKFLIAGDGPERSALGKLVQELSLGTQVCFLGRIPDVSSLFASADIFVLASRYMEEEGDIEGLGIVLLEAQREGVPIIATRSGGIPEALVPDETGFLVPEGDPQALAEKINLLAGDPGLRSKMGEKGEAFVAERFSPERAAAEYVSLYKECLAKSK